MALHANCLSTIKWVRDSGGAPGKSREWIVHWMFSHAICTSRRTCTGFKLKQYKFQHLKETLGKLYREAGNSHFSLFIAVSYISAQAFNI
jgi:hypothetical protein